MDIGKGRKRPRSATPSKGDENFSGGADAAAASGATTKSKKKSKGNKLKKNKTKNRNRSNSADKSSSAANVAAAAASTAATASTSYTAPTIHHSSTATADGQLMAQMLSTFTKLESSRFEAFQRSSLSKDAVQEWVAAVLRDRYQSVNPALTGGCSVHYKYPHAKLADFVAPSHADQIALVVSVLGKIYAQRLVSEAGKVVEYQKEREARIKEEKDKEKKNNPENNSNNKEKDDAKEKAEAEKQPAEVVKPVINQPKGKKFLPPRPAGKKLLPPRPLTPSRLIVEEVNKKPLQPEYIRAAFENRCRQGLDPGFFLQPAANYDVTTNVSAITSTITWKREQEQRLLAALEAQEAYDKYLQENREDDGDDNKSNQDGMDEGDNVAEEDEAKMNEELDDKMDTSESKESNVKESVKEDDGAKEDKEPPSLPLATPAESNEDTNPTVEPEAVSTQPETENHVDILQTSADASESPLANAAENEITVNVTDKASDTVAEEVETTQVEETVNVMESETVTGPALEDVAMSMETTDFMTEANTVRVPSPSDMIEQEESLGAPAAPAVETIQTGQEEAKSDATSGNVAKAEVKEKKPKALSMDAEMDLEMALMLDDDDDDDDDD